MSRRSQCLIGFAITGALITLRITDDGDTWETPLSEFLAHNVDSDDVCEEASALAVGQSTVMGFGMVVERIK